MTTPQRWQEIDRIFAAVLELEPAQRGAFLDEACSGDEQLRKEVESLLAHDTGDSIAGDPAFDDAIRLMAKGGNRRAAGDRIGPYLISGSIGAGGMGEVYLAKDKLGRTVALKLLNPHFGSDDSGVARFQQEAGTLLTLNHPHIVTIYDIDQVDSVYYIASELVEGETIRQRLDKGDIELAVTLEVAIQIATALAAAHEKGIVHRDIKPENIMIRPDGYVKVLDFGIAKLTAGSAETAPDAPTIRQVQTAEGTVVGTAPYMSPEQARGLPVDARTDIWSLGVVIYEIIAGRKPFGGATTRDVITSILEKQPAPLARYARNVPEGLEWIVSRALRKERETRYQTTSELLNDLRELKRKIEFTKSMSGEMVDSEAGPPRLPPTSSSTAAVLPAGSTNPSSAEYIVGEIKRHKRGVIIGLAIVMVLAITGLGAYFFPRNDTAPIQSIAVLPFENQNRDPTTDYLSDGLTENIINNLTQLPALRVVPRSSVFHYKGRDSDSMAVGRELGVRAVLTGRVMQRGDTLIVSTELVDIRDNKQLWGEQYTRKVSDALGLQQEISRQISDRLRLKLTGEEQKQLNKGGTANAEAYQFYMKGQYYWNKRGTSGSLQKAIDQFQQAVDKDPNYAMAYVGLADSYGVLEEYTGDQGNQILQKARTFAERALQIDNSLAEAHSSLALVYEGLWLWDDADREFKVSIGLNPNYPTAHQWHGELYLWLGRDEEGVAEFKRAQELDPLSLVVNMWLAELYSRKGDTDAANKLCAKVLELDRDFPRPYTLRGLIELKQGHAEQALVDLQKSVELSGQSSAYLRALGYAYGVLGRRDEALSIVKELAQRFARKEARAQDITAVYAGLGDKNEAFAWLEKDFRAHSTSLPGITDSAVFDSLNADARYAELLQRMGLRN